MKKILVCAVLAIIGCGCAEDIPEFQFPCYVDVCTFPRQFCNSDRNEKRCSPCSRALCKASQIPTACRYICKIYHDENTPSPVVTTASPIAYVQARRDEANVASLYQLSIYTAVCSTLTAVVVLLLIAYMIHSQRRSTKKLTANTKNLYSTQLPTEKGCKHCHRPTPETHNHMSLPTEVHRQNNRILGYQEPDTTTTADAYTGASVGLTSATKVLTDSRVLSDSERIRQKNLNHDNLDKSTKDSVDKCLNNELTYSIMSDENNVTEQTSLKSSYSEE